MHHSIMIYQFYLLMLLCYVVYVNDHWGAVIAAERNFVSTLEPDG